MKSYYVGWTLVNPDGENMSVAPPEARGEVALPEDAQVVGVQNGYVWWVCEV